MRLIACLPLLLMFAAPASAQPNDGVPLAPLPEPAVAADATPAALIDAAQKALAAGQVGQAQEAIERAESRLLVRDVDPRRIAIPSDDPRIALLQQARAALAAKDRLGAMTALQKAAKEP